MVRITRGPEYDLSEQQIDVAKGQQVNVSATRNAQSASAGWVATDFHAHSTPSGDNYCNTDDRITNFAAEHSSSFPRRNTIACTIGPRTLRVLGLDRQLKTIVGLELTGSGQHFNSFPLQVVPLVQDNGAPQWAYDRVSVPSSFAISSRAARTGGCRPIIRSLATYSTTGTRMESPMAALLDSSG